jgi:hypothetical protein
MKANDPTWPVTGREAARRLGLSTTEVTTLVRGLALPIEWHGKAMVIREPEYRRIEAASVAIVAARLTRARANAARRKAVGT